MDLTASPPAADTGMGMLQDIAPTRVSKPTPGRPGRKAARVRALGPSSAPLPAPLPPPVPAPASATGQDRAWVLLKSGKRLDLLDPHPMAWDDEDLATGLARTYRWGGHSRWELPLSVAQHSITVLTLAMRRTAPALTAGECLRELLHDGEEGLLGLEFLSPLKPHLGDGLRSLVSGVSRAVAHRYRLPDWTAESHAVHKHMDRVAAASEALHVVGWSAAEIRHSLRIQAKPLRFDPVAVPVGLQPWEPWPPTLAARLFLDMLAALRDQAAGEPPPRRNGVAAYPQPAMTRPMRVWVEGGRGDAHLEGEVVDGVRDQDGSWDLDGVFTVRTDVGELVRVNGWCCSTTEVW